MENSKEAILKEFNRELNAMGISEPEKFSETLKVTPDNIYDVTRWIKDE